MSRNTRLHHILVVGLIVLVAVGVAAQTKPDFLGRWILATPSQADADIPSALSVRQPLVRTTVRGDPMEPTFLEIAIERQLATPAYSETYRIGVKGGTVPSLRADGSSNGPSTHLAVNWDGNALVFETGSYTGQQPETGVWTERREVWSLDADGRLRVVISTRSSSKGSKNITAIYRRP